MSQNDDFLDAGAYLQSEIIKNFEDTKELIQEYLDIDEKNSNIEKDVDKLISDVEKIANSLEIDISEINAEEDKNEYKRSCHSSDFTIRLSEYFDYSTAFQSLVDKAHASGFEGIKPWHLFSAEELQQIELSETETDAKFSQETNLTQKDIQILVISVAIRVLYFFLLKIFANEATTFDTQDVPEISSPEPVIDAMQNVNVEGIDTKESVKQLLYLFGGSGMVSFKSIKSEGQVLNDALPFDVQDNEFFSRKDILAYHPMIGWLVGVINILTDTVTTTKLESFSVTKSLYDEQLHFEKVKNLGILLPFMFDCTKNKDSLLAAVVRQADALKVTSAPLEDVSAMLKETIAIEEHNSALMDKVDVFSQIIPLDLSSLHLGSVFRDVAITAFLNKLITAIHAVRYNPKVDGDMKLYTVRTNKIIAISSVIAASVNSLPALTTEDISQVDVSGMIMSLITVFNSTKFWIDVKADYLASTYKERIDEAFKDLDKYFEIV